MANADGYVKSNLEVEQDTQSKEVWAKAKEVYENLPVSTFEAVNIARLIVVGGFTLEEVVG